MIGNGQYPFQKYLFSKQRIHKMRDSYKLFLRSCIALQSQKVSQGIYMMFLTVSDMFFHGATIHCVYIFKSQHQNQCETCFPAAANWRSTIQIAHPKRMDHCNEQLCTLGNMPIYYVSFVECICHVQTGQYLSPFKNHKLTHCQRLRHDNAQKLHVTVAQP